ncbi:dihydroneopterin aldolase [Bifidobacterium xylocopae]|uniref:7,8-dihydroneopterin aldolase n=1 Tax=Bifidobacterium xylocopae TaxID=2493119 RepID=A0A366KDJ3_9BIFI|nr:dihydroneopterin aldolase [Bifidobacterium xylocopae]RBP99815.1 dihydroneopterin aldolase [Bifidobacterium xylocopae]
MDSIRLSDIRASSRPHAGDEPFSYSVDAELYLDVRAAADGDDLTETVDYTQVARRIVSLIEGMDALLVETVAVRVADSILLSHQVCRVEVTVRRLDAGSRAGIPMGAVEVRLARSADDDEPQAATSASIAAAQAVEHARRRRSQQGHPSFDDVSGKDAGAGDPEGAVHQAVIAMSGNIGPVREAMRTAIVSLDGVPGSQILGISPLYMKQGGSVPDRLCAVVVIETALGPADLMSALWMIESAHGRSHGLRLPSFPLELRLIDEDGRQWESEDLLGDRPRSPQWTAARASVWSLPDDKAWQQAEVLKPWSAVDPQARLCGEHGGPVDELAAAAPDRDQVTLVSDSWILGGSV